MEEEQQNEMPEEEANTEEDPLMTVFKENGNGEVLDKQQIYTALVMSGKNPKAIQIVDFLREKEKDEVGTIDFEEFRELYNSIEEPSVEAFKEALKTFDKDGSGYIDKEELMQIVTSTVDTYQFGEELTAEQAEQILQEADADKDNGVSIDELANYLMTDGNRLV